jgi:hypothetical protein
MKTITGLLGAAATLGVLGAAQAAPTADPNEALRANSFSELLEPIPNATALLQAMDEKPATENNVQLAQYYHHHHHHHRYWRRWRYHHHHHHHHHHYWR